LKDRWHTGHWKGLHLNKSFKNDPYKIVKSIYFEVCRAGETLVALIALVRSLSGVRPFMLKQLPTSGKLFAAVAASVLQ